MKKVYYSWEDVERGIDFLCTLLKNKNIDYVTGIPRGGLIPGVMISHRLQIKYITLNQLENFTTYEKVIIVDDIYDSGNTLTPFKEKGFTTLTLDKRHTTVGNPDYFSYIVNDDDWIIYPWESSKTETKQGYLIDKNVK